MVCMLHQVPHTRYRVGMHVVEFLDQHGLIEHLPNIGRSGEHPMLLPALDIPRPQALPQLNERVVIATGPQSFQDVIGQKALRVGQQCIDRSPLRCVDQQVYVVGHDNVTQNAETLACGNVHPIVDAIVGLGPLDQGKPFPAGERAEEHRAIGTLKCSDTHERKLAQARG